MNPIHLVLPILLLTLCAPCQGDSRDLVPMPPPANADALLGIWVSTGEDAERLDFRRDGLLLIDGVEARYRTTGNRLSIHGPGGACTATWEVVKPHLWITLRLEDGTSRKEGYRREGSWPAERATAGAATFALPSGWSVARADARSALLDLGLRAPDTLDALVIVTCGEVVEEARALPIAELLRSRLQEIATELVDLQVEIDATTVAVRAIRLPNGAGAELTVAGTAGGQHKVTVWIGATRNETQYAAVLAVVVAGREDRFLPGARGVLRSLQINDAGGGVAELTGEFGFSTAGSPSRTITYTFRGNGRVTVHRMFSSSVGSQDSTAHGTFTVRDDSVTMSIQGETVEATLERSGADIQALRIGATRYGRTR